jgi:drug/metabolite transporter (DMT)-like permease
VITAALPVLFNATTAGFPRVPQLLGFGLAIVGIWLVARGPVGEDAAPGGLALACVAGVGFGGFLVLIAQGPSGSVFAPLAVARIVMLVIALTLMLSRGTPLPSLAGHPFALLAGLLDAGGNVLYLLARQHIRLDVAAVLSSLYPVATVVLARVVSQEPVTATQWVGAGVCLGAVGLITI